MRVSGRDRLVRGIGVVVAGALVVGGGWAVSRGAASTRSGLSLALAAVPATTTTFSFTDWASVRHDLHLAHPRSTAQLDRLENDGFTDDLTTRSPLRDDVAALQKATGFSGATLDWDAFGQSPVGNVLVARLGTSVSAATVQRHLADVGWSASDGIWTIDEDDLFAALPGAPTDLSRLAFVDHGRTIVASESPALLANARHLWSGRGRSLASVASARQNVASLAGSTAVLLQDRANTCAATTLSKQTATVRDQARTAVAAAGALVAPVWETRALTAHGTSPRLAFTMTFGSGAVASEQAMRRAALAVGPFVGRTGDVQDVLRLTSSGADGSVARLGFVSVGAQASFMSNAGPLLFAACSP